MGLTNSEMSNLTAWKMTISINFSNKSFLHFMHRPDIPLHLSSTIASFPSSDLHPQPIPPYLFPPALSLHLSDKLVLERSPRIALRAKVSYSQSFVAGTICTMFLADTQCTVASWYLISCAIPMLPLFLEPKEHNGS